MSTMLPSFSLLRVLLVISLLPVTSFASTSACFFCGALPSMTAGRYFSKLSLSFAVFTPSINSPMISFCSLLKGARSSFMISLRTWASFKAAISACLLSITFCALTTTVCASLICDDFFVYDFEQFCSF